MTLRPARVPAAALGLSLLAGLGAPDASAVETRVFHMESQIELEAGSSDGVAIGAGGSLTLSPAIRSLIPAERADLTRSIFWCLAVDNTGAVWLGSGGDGNVIRVPAAGDASLAATFHEAQVTALAASPTGGVVAGTSPNGAIYSLKPGAAPVELFDPGERYIWSLQYGRDGTLFAGTGERGRIFAISPSGDGRLLFDGSDPHVMTLALDRQGSLLAGTSGRGVVLRVEKDGTAKTLFDSNGREVSGLGVDAAGDVIIGLYSPEASDLGASPPGVRLRLGEGMSPEGAPQAVPVPPVELGAVEGPSREITAVFEEGASVRVTPTPAGPRSEILRLTPGGKMESLWDSSYESLLALAASPDGAVFAATGEPAGIRRIEGGGQSPLLVRSPESQVTALALDRQGGLFLATSNAGNAYSLGPQPGRRGTFTSTPLDAGSPAAWGTASWDARVPPGGGVAISTRTGNSPVPDSTWSPWAPLPETAGGARIASPAGRYLQFRVEMTAGGGASPRLQGLSFTGRPFNRAPRIRDVAVPEGGSPPEGVVLPDGIVASSASEVKPATAAHDAEKPADSGDATRNRWVTFESSDPDGDPLRATLRARPQGAASPPVPVPLAPGAKEDAPAVSPLSWDDRGLAEGTWTLLVRLTDDRANPAGADISSEVESLPFIVDRTPPSVTPASGPPDARGLHRFLAADRLSPLRKAEYSADGTNWRTAGCEDGILDQREEQLLVPSDGSARVLRVTDAAGNTTRIELGPSGSAPTPAPGS